VGLQQRGEYRQEGEQYQDHPGSPNGF
jgi:hypothetical protein